MSESQPMSALRVVPQQARSRATVEHLLEIAAAIVATEGAAALTTSLLAERADVRIRTVYRYFPDRVAIVSALIERVAHELETTLVDLAARLADSTTPWDRAVAQATKDFMSMSTEMPLQFALRRAVRSDVQLRYADTALERRIADAVARALRTRGATASLPRLRIAATAFLAAGDALLDAVAEGDLTPNAAQREITQLALTYLGSYLPAP